MKKKIKNRKISSSIKILLVVIIPLIIIGCIAIIVGKNNEQELAYNIIQDELKGIVENTKDIFDTSIKGDFTYQNNILKKGDEVIDDNKLIDSIKENTDAEVTIFWGNERVMTTVEKADGSRAVGTTLDSEYSDVVLGGNNLFLKKVDIAGKNYCGYYIPLKNSSGKVVGMYFCGKSLDSVNNTIAKSQIKLILIILLIMLLSIGITITIIYKILKIIKYNINQLNKVAQGNLNIIIDSKIIKRNDELGEMAKSIDSLVKSFRSMINNIKCTTDSLKQFTGNFEESFSSINQNVKNVNLAVTDIANGATAQASEAMDTNNQVDSMGNTINSTEEKVNKLNENSKRMKEYSNTAEDVLGELSKINLETSCSVKKVKKQTDLTNESAKKIQKSTNIITDIASQTNLLSLNASIEASRAGEQGKGFAVVAEEIQNLSEQSKEAAEQISKIIETLILDSNTSVVTMNDMAKFFDIQNGKFSETKVMFTSLNGEIDSVADIVTSINDEMKTLDKIKNVVIDKVDNLSAIAEENAAETEETSSSMSEFKEIIELCRNETKKLVNLTNDLEISITSFSIRNAD